MMKKILFLCFLLGQTWSSTLFSQSLPALDYSFVVVGCNRVDKADTNSATNPSTANVYQLNRMFNEIMAMNPLPTHLFLAGDIVMGYGDTVSLEKQLKAWKALYLSHPIATSSVKLVLIPGNHETQNSQKIATASAERTWLRVMSPYIANNNGPKVGDFPLDSLKTDQSMMTYSFNYENDHYVLINTDATSRDWRVPIGWLENDLATATANHARHIFAIGHKPAYELYSNGDGLVKYPTVRNFFWNTMENNHAEAMFCAHNHAWDKIQPHKGKTYQVIAGNGGSLVEQAWIDSLKKINELPYLGYTVVNIYTDGKVVANSIGRAIPANLKYNAPADTVPTLKRDNVELTRGSTLADKQIDYTFVTLGCNRVDKADTNKAVNPSTANLYQLKRTLNEVAAMSPLPSFLFFTGDLVMGYTPDSLDLERQLKAWVAIYEAHPISKTTVKLVALPGNHETQNDKKVANAAAERTWLKVMGKYIAGNNGPKVGDFPLDSLVTDQSRMTYSFDFRKDHFLLLNTDATARDWRVPTQWIAADLAKARTNNARHIFAFGHKPAYEAKTASAGDALSKYVPLRDAFWLEMENNQAEAAFFAHNHTWEKTQPHANKTYQIIAGNGGSIVDAPWLTAFTPPAYPYFGYTLVTVYKDGNVTEQSMGRDIRDIKKYLANMDSLPTTVRDSASIKWGTPMIVTALENVSNEEVEKAQMLLVPNPTSGTTSLRFFLQEGDYVSIRLYNAKGDELQVLAEDNFPSGHSSIQFNPGAHPSGVYVVRLLGKKKSMSRSLVIAK